MQFGKLGEMIAAHTRLKEQSRFLFIPGPDDAGIDIVGYITLARYFLLHVLYITFSNFFQVLLQFFLGALYRNI